MPLPIILLCVLCSVHLRLLLLRRRKSDEDVEVHDILLEPVLFNPRECGTGDELSDNEDTSFVRLSVDEECDGDAGNSTFVVKDAFSLVDSDDILRVFLCLEKMFLINATMLRYLAFDVEITPMVFAPDVD